MKLPYRNPGDTRLSSICFLISKLSNIAQQRFLRLVSECSSQVNSICLSSFVLLKNISNRYAAGVGLAVYPPYFDFRGHLSVVAFAFGFSGVLRTLNC